MATREQLAKMAHAEGCRYLAFDNSSTNGMPETHSGSIQMFHSECGFEKVWMYISHIEARALTDIFLSFFCV